MLFYKVLLYYGRFQVQKTQCLSKRARKRFKDSQYENSPILNNGEVSTISERLDADLCREALVVLQNVLFSGGVLLKQTFYKVNLFVLVIVGIYIHTIYFYNLFICLI